MVPMLSYEDGSAALDWLAKAFGFEIIERWLDEQGSLVHGELAMGDKRVLVSNGPTGYQSPNTLAKLYPPAAVWQQSPYVINGVLVEVHDIARSFENAKTHGAKILTAIEEGFPGRRFRAADLEGNRWMFLEPA
jgi:PhnB protein